MNKLIFQIGLLGFCVAAVVFGGNGGSVIDIVSRSFIVFVGIVLGAMMIVLVSGTMVQKNLRQSEQQEREAENAGVQRNQQ
jgi:SNF family Na+-dependent transporter